MKIAKKLLLLTSGFILIVIGIFGIVLPILPGIFPLIIGLVLASKSSQRLENYKPLKITLAKLRESRTVMTKNMPNRIGKFINLL